MERIRESTTIGKEQVFWMILAVIALIAWLVYELYMIIQGRGSYVIPIYIVCMAGLLVWRCAVRYNYILTDKEIIVISELFGQTRQFTVPLDQVESYSNRFVKKFFRKTQIRHYVYRYSSIDKRPTRIVAFNEKGKVKGLLISVSDEFIAQLQAIMPNKFLDLSTETKKR